MKKTKRTAKFFYEPVFNASVFILIGGTVQELRQYFENRHGMRPDFDDNIAGCVWSAVDEKTQKDFYYVWLSKWTDSISSKGNLTHEVDHLVNWIFRNIGGVFTEDSEEFYSYYKEHWVETFLEYLKGKK